MLPPEDLSKPDPSVQWPEEVRKAYQNLKIPSLYDCLLTNEKLAVEIHRQNRELKEVSQNLGDLSVRLDGLMEFITEEFEEYDEDMEEEVESAQVKLIAANLAELEHKMQEEEPEDANEKKSQEVLIDANDILVEISNTTKQVFNQLTEALIKKEEMPVQEPIWLGFVQNLIQSHIDYINIRRYRLLDHLNNLNIQLIEPQPGDSFIAHTHRVIDRISGGPKGVIARLVRVGYSKEDEILRAAEVIVYS